MRHLFVAILLVVGALLIVQSAAALLQQWQIAQRPQWDGPAFNAALQLPASAPATPPVPVTSPVREAAH